MMARQRSKQSRSRSGETISAEQVGGSDPNAFAELATIGEYPEEFEQESEIWRAGYDLAARHGNTAKACVIFANNYQGEDLSDAAIEEEIARLKKIQDARSS